MVGSAAKPFYASSVEYPRFALCSERPLSINAVQKPPVRYRPLSAHPVECLLTPQYSLASMTVMTRVVLAGSAGLSEP